MAKLFYCEFGDYIYPITTDDYVTYSTPANNKKLKIHFNYKPADLTSDASSPAIPERYHLALVDFALSRLLGSAEHEARWKGSLSSGINYNRTATVGEIVPTPY